MERYIMTDKQLVPEEIYNRFSKHERYIAFLTHNLPRLQSVSINNPIDPVCRVRSEVLQNTLEHLFLDGGICLEFGVYQGDSLRLSALRHPNRCFFGFDSFEGFPDDGRRDWKQDFAVEWLPEVPNNCSLVKGWFSETLPAFLDNNSHQIDFINIDCDIYSSTVDVFSTLEQSGRLRPGQIIFFDELVNYSSYLWNESFALFEMLERTGYGIEWIAAHQNIRLVDETLALLSNNTHPTWKEDLRSRYRQQASLRLTGNGIDYGPMHFDHYASKVKRLSDLYDQLTDKYFKDSLKVDI